MPAVARDIVKDRARRLRAKGDVAFAHHLDREVGAQRRVLMESSTIGRTEYFTPVRLASPVEPGVILHLTVIDHNGRQLLAA
jgi:threonylcarbamoyladenosine tRNA methylthiotransferase MtaB